MHIIKPVIIHLDGLLSQKDYSKAIHLTSKYLTDQPNLTDNFCYNLLKIRMQAFANKDLWAESLADAFTILHKLPDHYLAGRIVLGFIKKAKNISINSDVKLWALYADKFYQAGDMKAAEFFVRMALFFDAKNIKLNTLLAITLKQQNKIPEAIKILTSIYDEISASQSQFLLKIPMIVKELVQLHFREDQYSSAKKLLKNNLYLGKKHPEIYGLLIQCCNNQGNTMEAEKYLLDLQSLSSENNSVKHPLVVNSIFKSTKLWITGDDGISYQPH